MKGAGALAVHIPSTESAGGTNVNDLDTIDFEHQQEADSSALESVLPPAGKSAMFEQFAERQSDAFSAAHNVPIRFERPALFREPVGLGGSALRADHLYRSEAPRQVKLPTPFYMDRDPSTFPGPPHWVKRQGRSISIPLQRARERNPFPFRPPTYLPPQLHFYGSDYEQTPSSGEQP